MHKNIISVSGGKDSQAQALLAIHEGAENIELVFADTGNEHQATYDHIEYLESALGLPIARVKADFSDRIEKKRITVQTKWRDDGISETVIERALEILKPTGIPFLDLCLWKGRFPGTRSRFCSSELKHEPLNDFTEQFFLSGEYEAVISWQGVRRDESLKRKYLEPWEAIMGDVSDRKGLLIYRPILDWTAKDVVAFSKKHGVKLSPLYTQGMSRVGCMPCIHVNKKELGQIAARFPDELARIAEWEALVSQASKRQNSTFLDGRRAIKLTSIEEIHYTTHGINTHLEWAKTCRGSDQFDLIQFSETQSTCSSQLGLCE